jgi:hypothetical protein
VRRAAANDPERMRDDPPTPLARLAFETQDEALNVLVQQLSTLGTKAPQVASFLFFRGQNGG